MFSLDSSESEQNVLKLNFTVDMCDKWRIAKQHMKDGIFQWDEAVDHRVQFNNNLFVEYSEEF